MGPLSAAPLGWLVPAAALGGWLAVLLGVLDPRTPPLHPAIVFPGAADSVELPAPPSRHPSADPSWPPWQRAFYHHASEFGAVDIVESDDDLFTPEGERVEGGWRGLETDDGWCHGLHTPGFQFPRPAVRGERHRAVRTMVHQVPHLGAILASAELIDTHPFLLLEGGETPGGTGLSLAGHDLQVLTEMYAGHPGGAKAMLGPRFCNSNAVVCAVVGEELRVTGLRLTPSIPRRLASVLCPERPSGGSDDDEGRSGLGRDDSGGEKKRDEATAADMALLNPLQLPSSAAALQHLRALEFRPLGAATDRLAPEDACRFLESLTGLEALVLDRMYLPATCTLTRLRAVTVLGTAVVVDGASHDLARALRTGDLATDAALREVFRVSGRPVPPAGLQFLCNSPGLLQIQIGRATGVPECFGGLTELRRLDLRGGRLQGRLPPQLTGLRKLVDFVAFEQGARTAPTDLRNDTCKLAWTTKAQMELPNAADEEANEPTDGALMDALRHSLETPWHCLSDGWNPTFDDSTQPWWAWTNIERFWVDVNFMGGGIPDWLPDKWPQLRTLDLYSNELHGPVPLSLCTLRQLDTLQIQDNNLSGVFPFAAFFGGACPGNPTTVGLKRLSLSLNPLLEGCLSEELLAKSTLDYLALNYTAVRIALRCPPPSGTT